MGSPDDQLMLLLRQSAHAGYIGEPVSQLEHALQAAALAEAEGADEDLVLAALLHDIGHFCDPRAPRMADVGVRRHEHVGAEFIRSMGLSTDVAELVGQHVNAKRYLVCRHRRYAEKLSAASRETLAHQGGPMSDEEAARFEQHPRFADILKLRAWDEAAKRVGASPPPLEHYACMLRRNRASPLSRAAMDEWQTAGYCRITDWFSEAETKRLRAAVTDLATWPDTPGKWMRYYEAVPAGDQLCRVENFVDDHPLLDRLCRGRSTLNLVSRLMGEPAVLFKEKINFKLPGGAGFDAHQDAPAFTSFNQSFHITLMLSIDETTRENGCLMVAPGAHRDGVLPTDDDLTMQDAVCATMNWQAVSTNPGDVVLFGSHLPHRSGPNRTGMPRRALYATYNKRSEGNVRARYFALKRQAFPPDVEREPGKTYDAGVFNVGNPVKH